MISTRKRHVQLQRIYNDIVAEFGKSKFYDWIPTLVVYHDDRDDTWGRWLYGDFDFRERYITVNLYPHNTLRSVVMTMLHEYRHYLQSPTWYTRHDAKYRYDDHPYEKDAEDFAIQHVAKFMKKGT